MGVKLNKRYKNARFKEEIVQVIGYDIRNDIVTYKHLKPSMVHIKEVSIYAYSFLLKFKPMTGLEEALL
jgi:hypothetical protein